MKTETAQRHPELYSPSMQDNYATKELALYTARKAD